MKKRVEYFFQLVESAYLSKCLSWTPTTPLWEQMDTWILKRLKQVIGWVGRPRYWRRTRAQLLSKLDSILGVRYRPPSTKVRIRRIRRIGKGAVKIFEAIDSGREPPVYEMINYATIANDRGEACLRPYVRGPSYRKGLRPLNPSPNMASRDGCWAPAHDQYGTYHRDLSWRAAAQDDMDSLCMHETREQCYKDSNNVGQQTTWRNKAAQLLDLEHLGTRRVTLTGNVIRTRSMKSLLLSIRRRKKGHRPNPTTTTRRHKVYYAPRDSLGNQITANELVRVCYRKHTYHDYQGIVHSFTKTGRCRIRIIGRTQPIVVMGKHVTRRPLSDIGYI